MSELNRMAQSLIERPLVEPPSVEELRVRNRKRHRHNRVAVSIAGVLALAVALVAGLLPSDSTASATIRLAGYTAQLPTGYSASSTPRPQCTIYPVAYPQPGHLAAALSTAYAINPPGAAACLGSWLTANYVVGPDGSAPTDPVAPVNGTHTMINGYSAVVADSKDVDLVITGLGPLPNPSESEMESTIGIWVQIPSIGGGYHDLIVGSQGLTRTEVLGLVESALPTQHVPAAAGRPPWATIPVCAPGQTPDPNGDDAQACAAPTPSS